MLSNLKPAQLKYLKVQSYWLKSMVCDFDTKNLHPANIILTAYEFGRQYKSTALKTFLKQYIIWCVHQTEVLYTILDASIDLPAGFWEYVIQNFTLPEQCLGRLFLKAQKLQSGLILDYVWDKSDFKIRSVISMTQNTWVRTKLEHVKSKNSQGIDAKVYFSTLRTVLKKQDESLRFPALPSEHLVCS